MKLVRFSDTRDVTRVDKVAFASAAKADVPKPSALQKSKAAIGLKGTDTTGKKEKSNENALRVAEVCSAL